MASAVNRGLWLLIVGLSNTGWLPSSLMQLSRHRMIRYKRLFWIYDFFPQWSERPIITSKTVCSFVKPTKGLQQFIRTLTPLIGLTPNWYVQGKTMHGGPLLEARFEPIFLAFLRCRLYRNCFFSVIIVFSFIYKRLWFKSIFLLCHFTSELT